MKNIILSFTLIAVLFSCNNTGTTVEAENQNTGIEYFGEEITKDNAITADEFFNSFNGVDSVELKVSGTINKVCKKKGCWMTMNVGDENQELFVKFKDYDFFVPLNADGRAATIEGWAYKEVQTVEALKHYAFDAGKTEEEIAEITEPEVSYTFMAKGVIIE